MDLDGLVSSLLLWGKGTGNREQGIGKKSCVPYSRLPTPDSRFPTPDSRLPIPDSLNFIPTTDPRRHHITGYASFKEIGFSMSIFFSIRKTL
ncbi:hypothetical protein [Moorena bouillonii]|uniref:hypothetical protein n=1 Tax=Moorena bouillonii TaxID=207920 RepID=UPI003F69CD70